VKRPDTEAYINHAKSLGTNTAANLQQKRVGEDTTSPNASARSEGRYGKALLAATRVSRQERKGRSMMGGNRVNRNGEGAAHRAVRKADGISGRGVKGRRGKARMISAFLRGSQKSRSTRSAARKTVCRKGREKNQRQQKLRIATRGINRSSSIERPVIVKKNVGRRFSETGRARSHAAREEKDLFWGMVQILEKGKQRTIFAFTKTRKREGSRR